MILTGSKIVILGAGHVGSHAARALAERRVAESIVLVDIVAEKAAAQAADIADALSWPPNPVAVHSGSYADCEDADITVVAIGKPREPGQTRLDLLGDSVRMVHELTDTLRAHRPGGLVISITNPCDIIADCVRRGLGMDRSRVFGTGTLLDTARLRRVLSEQTGAARRDIEAWVLGEHGDSSMIPYSCLRICGKPAAEAPGFDPASALERTHGIGMDIIEGKGSTEFGIGQSLAWLAERILSGEEAILPLSALLEGEYGLKGIHCGVPCRIDRHGIREIVTLPLTGDEMTALKASATVLERYTRMAEALLND